MSLQLDLTLHLKMKEQALQFDFLPQKDYINVGRTTLLEIRLVRL